MNRLLLLFALLLLLCHCSNRKPALVQPRNYYISNSGNDSAQGTLLHPFQSIKKLNSITLNAGDIVFFKGGETFYGNIVIDSTEIGNPQSPITIGSYGNGKAIIDAGETTALQLLLTKHIQINNLTFKGSGRKSGNTKDGVVINNCSNILLDSIEAKGFQKAGVLVYSSKYITLKKISATENGYAGISITADSGKTNSSNILIQECIAENNPGDPTNLTNHSGNGIVAAYSTNVVIEYCVATNNGWDMPRKGNGPVGIWCYEADSVIIQHCLSYKNKTSPGAGDGGGFDLDGGVTNSIIQYCLAYENEGSGYGLFQYNYASYWYNNCIRYCISENDGNVSSAGASVFISNSTDDASQFKDLFFYNNTIYNSKAAAICYEVQSMHKGFHFYNNIFVAKDSLVRGKATASEYLGNNWYNLGGKFKMPEATNFEEWVSSKKVETYNSTVVGSCINPGFINAGQSSITHAWQLKNFYNYNLPERSVLRNKGLILKDVFKMNVGNRTFNTEKSPALGVGACY